MNFAAAMTGAIIGIIGAYIITSIVLLKKPHILYKKRKRYFYATHISHRGGAGEKIENTMAAFHRAVNLSTDMLELDCHLLSNGDVVVSHDADLQRLTGVVNKDISTCTIDTLPLLLDKLQLTFSPDKYVIASSPEERQFALLLDVFTAFPNIPINVDIKVNNDELIHKVNDLIVQFNRERITVWGNRSHEITMKCSKANRRIGTFFSQRRIIEIILLFYTGLLPFFPIRESSFEIPMLSIGLQTEFAQFNISKLQRRLIWLFDKLLMRPALIKHLKDRGIPTYIWVCNTEKHFTEAFEVGAEGVMTDYPSLLKEFLDKYPKFRHNYNENDKLLIGNQGDESSVKKI